MPKMMRTTPIAFHFPLQHSPSFAMLVEERRPATLIRSNARWTMRMCRGEDRSGSRRRRARETAFRTPQAEGKADGGHAKVLAAVAVHAFSAAPEARI